MRNNKKKKSVKLTAEDLSHVGPDAPVGRYLRRFWHPVYRSQDIDLGWAKPIRILGEDFTLYRGENGSPCVVAFRCAHRGAQLSVGWVEGECIRCRFHGWKYDGSGQCVEQPAEKESFAAKVRVRACPTQEYLGLIFAYFGEGDAPPMPRYPDFEKDDVWVETYVRPCSYLNNVESDPIHVPFTHRESEFFLTRPVEIPDVVTEETEWGVLIHSTFPSGRTHISHHAMPNILCFREGDRDHLAWRVPIDDNTHASFQLDVTHIKEGEVGHRIRERHRARIGESGRSPNELGAAVLRGEVRIQDLAESGERGNIVWIQDYAVQVGQGPAETRGKEWLGLSDKLIILQRKIWLRELHAMLEDKPLKQWIRTERLAEMRTTGYA
jgi:5,5'-dehydrodivanillate O-demethylase oxygenase subunit